MTFSASSGQQAALPVQTTPQSTTVTNSGLLINGNSLYPTSNYPQATGDEVTFVGIASGTIQADSTFEVQISQNGTNFGAVKIFTNAEIINPRGFAAVVKVGVGNYFRVQFIAGTTTGGGNGVTVRYRN